MCGIAGYTGEKLGIPIVLDCLKRLEYRGYDSSGIAFAQSQKLIIEKKVGKLENLSSHLKNKILPSSCVIGHTRWATHGEPNKINAHPHTDEHKTIALVHNGIIENFTKIKEKLIKQNIKITTQTDTEIIAHLIAQELQKNELFKKNYSQNELHSTLHSTAKLKQEVLKIIKKITKNLHGAYACIFIIKFIPDCIFFFKNKSPLIIAKGDNESFLASDTSAILPFTNKILHIKDHEFGYIEKSKIKLYDNDLNPVKTSFETIDLKLNQIMLNGYKHFMHKEIEQGSQSVINTLNNLKPLLVNTIPNSLFRKKHNIYITACGTALHAGRIAKYLIENQLKIPVQLDYASEFRYKNPIINSSTICLLISQSGETADTLGALELAKNLGATTISITNTPQSRMEILSDYVLPTSAGPEIAVASTKAYLAQISAIYCLVDHIAKLHNKKLDFSIQEIIDSIQKTATIDYSKQLQPLVDEIKFQQSVLFLGRDLDYLLAMESALKLKEITYIHCEAMPAGELKHGSLALIKKDTLVIVILTQTKLIDKTLNNIHELNSRGAKVILFSPFIELSQFVYKIIPTPKTLDLISPFVTLKPLQMLAYQTSLAKDINPDKPRNLAKSVTVE